VNAYVTATRTSSAAAPRRGAMVQRRARRSTRMARRYPQPLRHGNHAVRRADYIDSGAETPSSSSERAITRCVATHNAMRNDSSASGSTPITRQSR
jgi:hypothetical protein